MIPRWINHTPRIIHTYIQTLFSSQKGFSENTKRKKERKKEEEEEEEKN